MKDRDERMDDKPKEGDINEDQNDGFTTDLSNNYEREKTGNLGSQPSFGLIYINSATQLYSINCKQKIQTMLGHPATRATKKQGRKVN